MSAIVMSGRERPGRRTPRLDGHKGVGREIQTGHLQFGLLDLDLARDLALFVRVLRDRLVLPREDTFEQQVGQPVGAVVGHDPPPVEAPAGQGKGQVRRLWRRGDRVWLPDHIAQPFVDADVSQRRAALSVANLPGPYRGEESREVEGGDLQRQAATGARMDGQGDADRLAQRG